VLLLRKADHHTRGRKSSMGLGHTLTNSRPLAIFRLSFASFIIASYCARIPS
jgi:hypothetical protein